MLMTKYELEETTWRVALSSGISYEEAKKFLIEREKTNG